MNGLSLEKLQETSVHSNYVSESSASARRRSDALERQDHDSAADRLNRNVAEKSAALQAEKTNERTKTSPHSLKNVCGICYCRYRTVQKPGSMIYQQGGSMTSSIRLCYIPPPWLTSQMFELTAGWIQDTAWTWLFRLHSYRIIHSDLMSIKSANVEVLRAALAAQELSIHDIDQKGRSLLWVSSFVKLSLNVDYPCFPLGENAFPCTMTHSAKFYVTLVSKFHAYNNE